MKSLGQFFIDGTFTSQFFLVFHFQVSLFGIIFLFIFFLILLYNRLYQLISLCVGSFRGLVVICISRFKVAVITRKIIIIIVVSSFLVFGLDNEFLLFVTLLICVLVLCLKAVEHLDSIESLDFLRESRNVCHHSLENRLFLNKNILRITLCIWTTISHYIIILRIPTSHYHGLHKIEVIEVVGIL